MTDKWKNMLPERFWDFFYKKTAINKRMLKWNQKVKIVKNC